MLIQTSDLMALLTQYRISDVSANELIELARISRRPTVGSRYRDVMTDEFSAWLEFELYANHVRQYEMKLVPGILQIYGYAYSIIYELSGRSYDEDYVHRIAQARLERAEHLTAPTGPTMNFIIDEGALRRGVGNLPGKRDFGTMMRVLKNIQRLNTIGRAALGTRSRRTLTPE